VERIGSDDYYAKNHEFSAWLKQTHGKVRLTPALPMMKERRGTGRAVRRSKRHGTQGGT